MKSHRANAAKEIIELRKLPPEVQIKSKLKIASKIRNLERVLWLTSGFLNFGYDLASLNKVQKQYAKIDMVPDDYVHAELYMRNEETEN